MKKLPKTNRSRIVLSESDDSKWTAVADPGEGPGGLGPPPYFWTKLRPETTSKIEMSTQDGIIFKGPKSISPRPKDKEKPNNHISVGKGA